MKLIAPDYYSSFACLMGACRHSCCIGWEIDIDEDSLQRYRSLSGALRERVCRRIETDGEFACFRMDEKNRCPFLNADGLCDMILELGEDWLCQICADHPRFRNFFADRTEIGLGMCCEAAAALILSHEEPVHLLVIGEDDEPEASDADEADLLALRKELIDLMQNRSLSLSERLSGLIEFCRFDPSRIPGTQWADFFLSLERMDEEWTARLQALPFSVQTLPGPQWDIPFEQLMVYLLYRHLPAAMEDGNAEGRVALCVLLWHLIHMLFSVSDTQTMTELIELCRLCSCEIEYSAENIDAVIAAAEDTP